MRDFPAKELTPLYGHFQFMLRQQVLKLYREALRTIREVKDESQRRELQMWARHDFESNKHVEDEVIAQKKHYCSYSNNLIRV